MLKFDFRELKRYFPSYFKPTLRRGMEEGFDNAGRWLTRYSRNHHPTFKNRTNTLAKSLEWNRRGLRGDVSSNVFYSKFMYDGTKRHFIKPVNKLALSWVQNGTRLFSRGHWVRGVKKSEWIKKNYEERTYLFNKHVTDAAFREFGD